jgi:integrase/recombinase XerD
MEADGCEPHRVTVKSVCDSFINDAETRDLKSATVAKYNLLFTRFQTWAASEGLEYFDQFDLDALRRFRGTWSYKNFALRNQTERLRSLFAFAHDSGWVQVNVAKKLKAPATHVPEVVPFTEEEVSKILAACDQYTPTRNAIRLRALVYLLLHSGLRIGDAVMLARSKIVDGRLTLRTQKKGVSVSLPLPPVALKALAAIPDTSAYYFTTGNALSKAVVGNYQNYLLKLFRLAGVAGAYPHKFRHSFAARLLAQRVPLEHVSKILGHSSTKVTILHYSTWIQERQELLDADVRATWTK